MTTEPTDPRFQHPAAQPAPPAAPIHHIHPGPGPYRPPLDMAIRPLVDKGFRVTYRDDWTATLEKGGDTNHVLHLLLSVFTAGLWLFVWPLVAFSNRKQTKMVTA